VDQQLKERMKELGEAINESLSDSESIAGVVSRIKEGGYDIFLTLEATIGISKQGGKMSDETSFVWPPKSQTPFNLRVGEHVRVGPLKPDGTPHPSAGKTGSVRKLLQLDDTLRAVVEVDNDFVVVSAESLEALP
jgi:hypothetical protein